MTTKRIDPNKTYTAHQTAALLGLGYKRTLAHIHAGNLVAHRPGAGAAYDVPGASILSFLGIGKGTR
jgi:hypothetical protein